MHVLTALRDKGPMKALEIQHVTGCSSDAVRASLRLLDRLEWVAPVGELQTYGRPAMVWALMTPQPLGKSVAAAESGDTFMEVSS